MLLLLVLGCKDKDEEADTLGPVGPVTGFNAIPKRSLFKFPAQGGSKTLEWHGNWSDVWRLDEYPASLYYSCFDENGFPKEEDNHFLGGEFYKPDYEYAIKHPIVWKGDTLEGAWFRIIKQYDAPENLRVLYNDTRCHKNIIETQPNTTGEDRVLVFAVCYSEPVFIIQEGSSE